MLGLLELGNTGSQETGVGEKNTRQFRWITVYDLLRHMYDVRRAPRRAQSAVMPVRVNGAGQLTVFAWMLFNCCAVNVDTSSHSHGWQRAALSDGRLHCRRDDLRSSRSHLIDRPYVIPSSI